MHLMMNGILLLLPQMPLFDASFDTVLAKISLCYQCYEDLEFNAEEHITIGQPVHVSLSVRGGF